MVQTRSVSCSPTHTPQISRHEWRARKARLGESTRTVQGCVIDTDPHTRQRPSLRPATHHRTKMKPRNEMYQEPGLMR